MTSPNILKKAKEIRERYIVINQEPVNNHPGNDKQGNSNHNDNNSSITDKNKYQHNNNNQHHNTNPEDKDRDEDEDDDEDMAADVIFLPTDDSPKIIMGNMVPLT